MVDIRPFAGYVPAPDVASKVASPPYDVMNSDEARAMAAGNPLSFLRVVKPEVDLDAATNAKTEEVYARGAANLQSLIDQAALVRSDSPCFYLYRIKMGSIVQTGIVAGASVAEYDSGVIKKHEFTRPDKEDDRARHVTVLNANTGPVFLTYRHEDNIDALVHELTQAPPHIDFVADDQVAHTLWVVKDEAVVAKISGLFAQLPALYVADGHHRSAAASRVCAARKEAQGAAHRGDESYNHFLTVIFPDNQLHVMDYNRVVKDLQGLSSAEFLAKVGDKFEVEAVGAEIVKPSQRGSFSMLLEGTWYRLKAKSGLVDPSDPIESLDVAVLQNHLLQPILGIEDPRRSDRIDFVGGIRGLGELVSRCEQGFAVAFALFPTGLDQLMAIADKGEVMPPKSTWFEPKLRSGMIVRRLD